MRYLTQRSSGFRFQIRIPCDLESIYGKTPIRISLGLIPAMKARRICRLLAGRAEQAFSAVRFLGAMDDISSESRDDRDQLIEELQELLVTSMAAAELEKEVLKRESLLEIEQLTHKMTKAALIRERELVEQETRRQQQLKELFGRLNGSVGQLVEAVYQAKKNGSARNADPIVKRLDSLQFMLEELTKEAPTKALPHLSSVLKRWKQAKLDQDIAPDNVKGQINRIQNFIDYCGDRPLDKYKFLDFQEYANLLVYVPANWHRRPEMRDGTLQEAADYNNGLPPRRRHETLTETTISEKYLSPLKSIFRDMAGQHDFPNPFIGVAVRISTSARESIERQPLSTEELNVWFRSAAQEKRADLKWLPLLATLTGARLAELVFLQAKDIVEVTPGRWAADLTKKLVNEAGEGEERKTKNRGSKRLFALHSALVEAGFIQYVATLRDEEWLFPHAHGVGEKLVQHPADAASKRLNRRLKKVGIHKPYEVTFHSTRHSAKDIFRDGNVPEHTHDMQTGHVTKTVARGYGAKKLRNMDVELISALPLPEGLDLSPYLELE